MENKILGKKRQTPSPTPAMIAYIKTICGEFGLEHPNLRCFVASKNFLDSDAPKEILKIQKVMTLFSKKVLPEMELSGVDDINKKREALSEVLVETGYNLGPKTIDKILNKGVPDLRKYGEGLFDDVGQKLLDNISHNGFKKKSKEGEVVVVDKQPQGVDSEQSLKKDYSKNTLPKNNFDYDEMMKASKNKDFMGYIERRVVDGYLSLVPSISKVEYSDFYKTSDSFDELKKSIRENGSLTSLRNRAGEFADNISKSFSDGSIDDKTCKSYKRILQSSLKELKNSELVKSAGEKIKKVEEILTKLIELLSSLINRLLNSFGLSRG